VTSSRGARYGTGEIGWDGDVTGLVDWICSQYLSDVLHS